MSGCAKVAYGTEAEAWLALFEIALSPPRCSRTKPIRPYRCVICGQWHVTSQYRAGKPRVHERS
jgi:hypothetical protein